MTESETRPGDVARVTCAIEGAAEEIFSAFTDPAILSGWIGPAEAAPVPAELLRARLKILHSDPPFRLALRFGPDVPSGTGPTLASSPGVVSLNLMAFGEIQVASLVHEGLPPGEAERVETAWNAALDRLAIGLDRRRREGGEGGAAMP